ncbi:ABC-ATPase domain-containing protein [Candidatus Nitrospira salsa]|nr:MAG: ATPase [Nitrospirales bacterium]
MKTLDDLRHTLKRIDGRGYKAYKEIVGAYDCEWWTLFVDHVQGDPFAAPTKIRARVNHNISHLPADLWTMRVRCVALRDFLARTVHRTIQTLPQRHRGIGKSGLISIDVGGQEILERSAVVITEQWVEARIEVGLPASGRTILGKHADAILCQEIPHIIQQSLLWAQLPQQLCQGHVDYAENYDSIQRALSARGLVAFVADGSILPRESGNSTQPLSVEQAKPWLSPDSLQVAFDLPHSVMTQSGGVTRLIKGLGVPRGITLIVGGGYHGKSTLLQAIQCGVYPHVPGDGREYVVTSSDAVKVRAEDGRRIGNVDISGFISHLPQHLETSCFSTDNASGSTSQAASILEALEVGSRVILLDEDSSATNFLVRDARMQALVKKSDEPITPFLDRVEELHGDLEMSTILVLGGCGDYFDVADTVICMKEFQPVNVTGDAKEIARTHQSTRRREVSDSFPPVCTRILHADGLDPSYGRKDARITVRAVDEIAYGGEIIRLEAVEQLVDESQTRAVGYALYLIKQRFMNARTPLREIISALESEFDQRGLDVLNPFFQTEAHPGNFARPRGQEIVAALNRLRTTRFDQIS